MKGAFQGTLVQVPTDPLTRPWIHADCRGGEGVFPATFQAGIGTIIDSSLSLFLALKPGIGFEDQKCIRLGKEKDLAWFALCQSCVKFSCAALLPA